MFAQPVALGQGDCRNTFFRASGHTSNEKKDFKPFLGKADL